MTQMVTPAITVTLDGVATPQRVTGGAASLETQRVPYAAADVLLPLTPETLLDELDPRDDHRIIVHGSAGGPVRLLDLGLRSRAVDHHAKTVTLQAASDEALLMDYASLVRDTGAFEHQDSLRGIVDYVLGKIGAALEPGGPDSTFSVLPNSTNLILDPGTAASAGAGWSINGCSLDNQDTTWSISGDGDCFTLYAPTKSDSYLQGGAIGSLSYGVQAGKTYTLSATGRVKKAVGGTADQYARRLVVVYKRAADSGYTVLGSNPLPVTVGQETRISLEFTLPSGTTDCSFRWYLGHTVGEVSWDGFRLSEKDPAAGYVDVGYFDGDTPDTTEYRYDWTGAKDASPSTRTALFTRAPELLDWEPGVNAWDFVSPLATSAGLRLFCDELRAWRLIDPGTYEVPGYVPISPLNATEGIDTVARDDPEVFATGVVCRYIWTDRDGVAQRETDSAGTPEKVVVVEYRRAYPGPGAAAAILARRNGTGRIQDVQGLARWDATPGMVASISLPSAIDQLGKIDAVEWALDDTGLMRLGTRGLIDIVPGSWLAWNPNQAWQDVAPAITWESVEV